MKSISKKNKEMEEDLDESSIDTISYEPTERNIELEKINITYSNSLRGRIVAVFDRFSLQLRRIYDRFILFISGRTAVVKTFLIKGIDILRVFLYNEYCNKILRKDINQMSKDNNIKTDANIKNNAKSTSGNRFGLDFKSMGRAIIGIMTLFVVVSIAYSAWVIVQGTDGLVHRIMVVPMVIWAAVKLVQQFSKQGDK